MSLAVAGRAGQRCLLMGNEALARGALEAGVWFVAAYPGTPSSGAAGVLVGTAGELGIYAEWSVNEKAACGASIAGAKVLAVMKNAGLNVAMDTFMTVPYGGIRAGLVVVVDDPGAHFSSTEQDTRAAAQVVVLDAAQSAAEAGSSRTLSMIMVGALWGMGAVPAGEEALKSVIGERVPSGTAEMNLRVFRLGRDRVGLL